MNAVWQGVPCPAVVQTRRPMSLNPSPSAPPPAETPRKRIFLLDDHPIMRHGLSQLFNAEPDLLVCGEAENAQQALAAMKPPLPDLILADVAMPGKSIIEFVKDMQALHAGVPVLVFSMHEESAYAERLVRAGARGYLMKAESSATLLLAVRQILQGQPYLSPAMSARAFASFGGHRTPGVESPLDALTDREFEVFQLLGEGKTNREVARQLSLSPKTVEAHRLNLCRKLKLSSPGQLIRFAVEQGQPLPKAA